MATLPIFHHKENILSLIESNQVSALRGDTGCGKSTQVPQFLLSVKSTTRVLVTQPRRIAAQRIAERVASEQKCDLGSMVGYRIAGQSVCRSWSKLIFCTTGFALQQFVHDPQAVFQYSHILLDEVHERSIDSDFLFLVLREMISSGWKGKLILMSATIDIDEFQQYFVGLPKPYYVGAKRYSVRQVFIDEVNTVPPASKLISSPSSLKKCFSSLKSVTSSMSMQSKPTVKNQVLSFAAEVSLHYGKPGTSVLIFLPGMAEMNSLYLMLEELLQKHQLTEVVNIFLLHSQVPFEEQAGAFHPPTTGTMHIILSTNIAESSLTIPRLYLVIDSAIQQVLRYSPGKRMSSLSKEWCSIASCTQRSGRAGREFDGLVIHLIPKKLFSQLSNYAESEMLNAPVEQLYLQSRVISPHFSISSPSKFLERAPHPPSCYQLKSALSNLAELGAITSKLGDDVDELAPMTQLGQLALKLPIDVALSRLVLLGYSVGMAYEAVIIAADISFDQDTFAVPNPFTSKTNTQYVGAVQSSLEARYQFDGGFFSDAVLICQMFDKWMKFRASNAGSRNRLCKQFSTEHGVHAFRLSQLESMVSLISRKLAAALGDEQRAELEALCNIHHVTDVQCTSDSPLPSLKDPLRIKALVALAFGDRLLIGTPERYGNFPGRRRVANKELTVMADNNFDPASTVVLRKLEGKCASEKALQELTVTVFPNSDAKSMIHDCTGYVQAPATTATMSAFDKQISVLTKKPSKGLCYIWHYADRGKFWVPKGMDVKFPVLRHPLQVEWQLASASMETVRSLSYRNPAGFVCDLSAAADTQTSQTAPSTQLLAVAGSMVIRSPDFITARSVTVLPSVSTENPTALLVIMSAQTMYNDIEFLVNESLGTIIGCKICGNSIDFSGCQITTKTLDKINAFRSALSDVLQSSSTKAAVTKAKSAFDGLLTCEQSETAVSSRGIWKAVSPGTSSQKKTTPVQDKSSFVATELIPLHDFLFYPPLDASTPKKDVENTTQHISTNEFLTPCTKVQGKECYRTIQVSTPTDTTTQSVDCQFAQQVSTNGFHVPCSEDWDKECSEYSSSDFDLSLTFKPRAWQVPTPTDMMQMVTTTQSVDCQPVSTNESHAPCSEDWDKECSCSDNESSSSTRARQISTPARDVQPVTTTQSVDCQPVSTNESHPPCSEDWDKECSCSDNESSSSTRARQISTPARDVQPVTTTQSVDCQPVSTNESHPPCSEDWDKECSCSEVKLSSDASTRARQISTPARDAQPVSEELKGDSLQALMDSKRSPLETISDLKKIISSVLSTDFPKRVQ